MRARPYDVHLKSKIFLRSNTKALSQFLDLVPRKAEF